MISNSSGSCGNERNRSVSHISAASTLPRAVPATAPMTIPTTTATSMAVNPDRHRDTAAIEHTGKQILAEIIGAKRMCPGSAPARLGAEIDRVDRNRPDQRPKQQREDHDQ